MMNVRIGRIGRLFAPAYGQCRRCRTPWKFVEHHDTPYAPGAGCFALCVKCWEGLGTPAARLPYYAEMYFRDWVPGGTRTAWADIERAVRAE